MNYELCKKLKDAGFPQPEVPTGGHYDSWILRDTYGEAYYPAREGKESNLVRLFPGMCYAREMVYIPRTTDLIQACQPLWREYPDGDEGMFKIERDISGEWSAGFYYYEITKDEGVGSTTKEALANLFLNLKNHGHSED